MKKLLDISSEERNRILEMHQEATRKNYLTEAPLETPLGSARIANPQLPINSAPMFYITSLFAPNELIKSTLYLYNPNTPTLRQSSGEAKILSRAVTVTEYGKKLGIDQSKVKVTIPTGSIYYGVQPGTKLGEVVTQKIGDYIVAPVTVSFPAPQTPFKSTPETAKQPVMTVTFETNDKNKPTQSINVYFADKAGVAVGAETTPR
jgi:hypothetical protein